ncbi:CopG family transcriptional regulator [Streptomyces sp. STCH 565 A]|uniref:ribbon-helix-helix domain-containing protein n=1 Tax=Streptomyces sp. STCH 565 A TaxID=2950532 RepID=UPI002076277A|nr:CopG family transcriptional regulator [Streptomyces sp. STCH 565 A]MCM8552271.1 ribbon-helix-helix domain-containing protein [Streptomyces sp. STCH 565 A]
MSRISFTDPDTGNLSWFDPKAARDAISEGRNWTGENWIGACSGLRTSRAVLYLTKGGRWIENQDATSEFNGADVYRFLTDDQAHAWLIKSADARRDSDEAEAALKQHFPDTPDEEGPDLGGRPVVGPKVETRVSPEILARIEARAVKEDVSRAEMLRRLIEAGLE